MTEDNKCTCIECKKEFEAYEADLECHVCGGEGYIEDEDWQRPPIRKCWQCNGKGELRLTEYMFCDENCREDHFNLEL